MSQISQALESLKKNQSYQVLVEELQRIQNSIDNAIFDESTPDDKRRNLVVKRNTIKNFIELPDDLINIEILKDVSNDDSSEN